MLKHKRAFALVLVAMPFSTAFALAPSAISIGNHVSSSVKGPDQATWDPGDAMTVTGQLRAFAGTPCADGGAINPQYDGFDFKFVGVEPPVSPGLGTGHSFCSAVSQTPGTDASGNFTFTVRGGGVSWSAGDGTSTRGSIVSVAFQEGEDIDYVTLLCGNSATYPVLSAYGGCPSAPEIYGKLASPDLTGDMFVDASDIPLLGSCITGQPTTLVWGWQADFNHDGWADAQDIAYFAGRIQKSCASQKAGASDFDMNVSNLEDSTVGALLVRYGITRSSVIAMWDAMGLSYDRVAANRITASAGTSWAEVKAKYRRP